MKCRNSIWQNLAAINIKNSHQLRDRRKLHPSDRMPLRTAYYSALKFCFPLSSVQFSSVQLLTCVWLFATPWIAAHQASLSITISRSSLKLTSIKSVMPSSHLIPCRPLFLLPPQLVAWDGQSTGVSALASFLPKNTQDWSPSEWTGWISLQPKGLSKVLSNTTVQKHQFFSTQLSPTSVQILH